MKKFLSGRVQSFKHAFNGLYSALSEVNLLIHIIATISVVIIGLYKGLDTIEWLIITLCIGFVISAELFNTAIEKAVDYISEEHHPLAKKIKDISAAGVLIAAITAAIIGIVILFF